MTALSDRLNAIVYDCECINLWPPKGNKAKKDPKWKYCANREDYHGMGLACICAYDLWTRTPRVFTRGNFADFSALLKERDIIIGFNSLGFDDRLCQANNIKVTTTYDLLREARLAVGEPSTFKRGESRGGFALSTLCANNNLPTKTHDPEDAPKMWQAAQYGAVIDYCLHDVMMTYRLILA